MSFEEHFVNQVYGTTRNQVRYNRVLSSLDVQFENHKVVDVEPTDQEAS